MLLNMLGLCSILFTHSCHFFNRYFPILTSKLSFSGWNYGLEGKSKKVSEGYCSYLEPKFSFQLPSWLIHNQL